MCFEKVDLNRELRSPRIKLKSATASGSNLSIVLDRLMFLSAAPIMSALEPALLAPEDKCTLMKLNVF